LGVPMLLGPICGPILGGWLIEAASWHWIFLINLPIGIVALTMALRLLPKDDPSPSESFDFVGMLLLSPGLALLLFGVSSVTETGTFLAARVLVPGVIGAALVVAFVFHAFGPEHPLIDLRLLKDKYMTIAVIAMSLFALAFFGAGLLFPSYFLQARGETTLAAGLLVAPQGLGAMLSMPIAGTLNDRIGAGRVVVPGMVLMCAGMAVFTQVGAATSYWLLGAALFVMGLGMGATMMPIMSAALATLTHQQVARGSTLMNIIQQVAGAVGTATMSVILANQEKADPTALAIAFGGYQQARHTMPPEVFAHGLDQLSSAFGFTFLIAVIVLAFTLIPAFLLPRKKVTPTDAADTTVPMMVG
ncbi:MAG: DHA2 family efflux MFS transporter permease subunit, partial [Jatrophihabitans sp.]